MKSDLMDSSSLFSLLLGITFFLWFFSSSYLTHFHTLPNKSVFFFAVNICFYFTVWDFNLLFRHFLSLTSCLSNSFSIMLLILFQIDLYFSRTFLFLISNGMHLVFWYFLRHILMCRSVMSYGQIVLLWSLLHSFPCFLPWENSSDTNIFVISMSLVLIAFLQ